MRTAWRKIKSHARQGIIIDLFHMGIYFSNITNPRQIFSINY